MMDKDVEARASLLKNQSVTQKHDEEEEDDEEEEEEEEEDEEIDHDAKTFEIDKKWTLILAGFVINCLASAGTFNFGILFTSHLLELGSSSWFVSCVGNLSVAASNLASLPVASLIPRWGCRRTLLPIAFLYCSSFILASITYDTSIPYAVAAFIANSCRRPMQLVVQVALCNSFQRGRPLALSVSMSGTPLSQIGVSPVVTLLQKYYDLKTILLMIGIFMGQICIAAIHMPSKSPYNNPSKSVSYTSLLKQRKVLFLSLLLSVNAAAMGTFWNSIPLILFHDGLTSQDLSLYISVCGVVNFIFRLLSSSLVSFLGQAIRAFRISSAIFAVTIIIWYYSDSLVWRLCWLSLCWGSTGILMCSLSLVIIEVIGNKVQGEMLGLYYMSGAVLVVLIGQITDVATLVTGYQPTKLFLLCFILMLSQLLWEFL